MKTEAVSPLLKVTDLIYGSEGTVLGVFVTFYRGDRIRLLSTS